MMEVSCLHHTPMRTALQVKVVCMNYQLEGIVQTVHPRRLHIKSTGRACINS
jgi:hypothetical protein